jgi:hypothetical protein
MRITTRGEFNLSRIIRPNPSAANLIRQAGGYFKASQQ